MDKLFWSRTVKIQHIYISSSAFTTAFYYSYNTRYEAGFHQDQLSTQQL